jgi:hypothetical protein
MWPFVGSKVLVPLWFTREVNQWWWGGTQGTSPGKTHYQMMEQGLALQALTPSKEKWALNLHGS